MTEAQFVRALANALNTTDKAAKTAMRQTARLISKALAKDGRFAWRDLGVWKVSHRKARNILNPATGETMRLPRSLEVRFRVAKQLRLAQVRIRRRKA